MPTVSYVKSLTPYLLETLHLRWTLLEPNGAKLRPNGAIVFDVVCYVCSKTLVFCSAFCPRTTRSSGGSRIWGYGGPTFLGIRFAPPPPPLERFSWSHYKSLYLDFLGFRIAPPLVFFFSEATIKVYTWIFFWSHYKSLYLDFLGFRIAPPLVFFFSEATIKVYTSIFFLKPL